MAAARPKARATWLPLRVGRAWNRLLRESFARRSGVYAIREAKGGRVLYVGESHTDRGWSTLTRHFQDPSGKFARRNEFTRRSADGLEAAVWLTEKGQAALDLQAAKIASLKPVHNRDDGKAEDDLSGPWDREENPRRRRAWMKLYPNHAPAGVADEMIAAGGWEVPRWVDFRAKVKGVRLSAAERKEIVGAIVRAWPKGAPYRPSRRAPKRLQNGKPPREVYKAKHWGDEGGSDRTLRVPDPTASPLVELGELVRVEYRTIKGVRKDGGRPQPVVFFHDFEGRKPVLAFNRDGLVIAGGSYKVTDHGIEG